mmetsp:Transcript_1747/g.5046  ORF Transcript_1747/g.5046 Transcript_1747/m.5046 type:complete len:177 (-) Transcript_1747:185-715(-)
MASAMCRSMASLSLRPCRILQAQRLSAGSCSMRAPQRILAAPRPVQMQPCARGALLVVAGSKNKVKTRKAAAKRFRITGTGKVMRRRPGKQHINEKMSTGQLKRLGKAVQVADVNISNITGCLPYAKLRKGAGKKDKKVLARIAKYAKPAAAPAAAAPAAADAPAAEPEAEAPAEE